MPRNPRAPKYALLPPILAAFCAALLPCAHADSESVGDSPVGLAELIALGLKNTPSLIASRGEISIAEARKRAARDWPDPQIRFRKTWGYNDVPRPHTETRTESSNQRVTRTRVDENGVVRRSTSNERVRRTTERTITPGRDRTTIREEVRERSNENTNTEPNAAIFDPGGRSTDNQSSFRSSTESRDLSFDPFASEEDLSAQFRLYLPHPAVRRATLARAQREIDLARNVALADEHQVVLEIREIYEELQYLKTSITLSTRGAAAAEHFATAQDELLDAGLITIDKLDYIDPDRLAAEGTTLEFEAKRDQLAARVGLYDAARIRVTDRLISPTVNIDHTHLEYLIRLALANRGDLSSIRGQGMIAEAELREFKAGLIPFPDYVQAEFGRDERGGERTGTSWGIQFAMSLPIFSLLGHEREIYEASIASHYSQMGASRRIVSAEVAAAYQNVKRSAAYRARARSHSVARAKRNKIYVSKLEGMDPHKQEETRYDINRGTIRTDRRRLDAERAYNRALLQLEGAIGTSLERAFVGGEAPPEAIESAAPVVPVAPAKKPSPPVAETPPATADTTPRKRGFFDLFKRGEPRRSSHRFPNRRHR